MDAMDYIRRETRVSILINSALSLVFFLAVFGLAGPVPIWGMGKFVFDFIPQSFMIALMSTLVPGFLTAKKLAAGALERGTVTSPLPRNVFLRALLLAVISAVLGTGIMAVAMLVFGIVQLAWLAALFVKVAYGAILATVITPPGLRAALAGSPKKVPNP